MARPSKLAHVVYRTRRFDEMVDWYARVLEADVRYKNSVLAFLTYDDEHHRVAFVNLAALKPGSAPAGERTDAGVDHVAYTYANLGDLLDTYSRLKQQGIQPYWPVHHGPTLSFYYKDPDGNRLEFQWIASRRLTRRTHTCRARRLRRTRSASTSIRTRW